MPSLGQPKLLPHTPADNRQTLVAIGADIGKLNTAGDLQGGIEEAEHLLGRLVRTEGPEG